MLTARAAHACIMRMAQHGTALAQLDQVHAREHMLPLPEKVSSLTNAPVVRKVADGLQQVHELGVAQDAALKLKIVGHDKLLELQGWVG